MCIYGVDRPGSRRTRPGAAVAVRRGGLCRTWAGLFYVATVWHVGTGSYLIGGEVVIDGVRFDLPGPLLSP
jgi:hypothetical protein